MYIIEKILKLFFKKKKYIGKSDYKNSEIENCEHLFVPIDSSCEYLSCIKCGKLIKNTGQFKKTN